jgi:hypothetical protein
MEFVYWVSGLHSSPIILFRIPDGGQRNMPSSDPFGTDKEE